MAAVYGDDTQTWVFNVDHTTPEEYDQYLEQVLAVPEEPETPEDGWIAMVDIADGGFPQQFHIPWDSLATIFCSGAPATNFSSGQRASYV